MLFEDAHKRQVFTPSQIGPVDRVTHTAYATDSNRYFQHDSCGKHRFRFTHNNCARKVNISSIIDHILSYDVSMIVIVGVVGGQ